ncbi:Cytochrome P450 CYP4/CYP19/CYP26 subfamily [Handroanthus impetiginosus]|uniref:Cytochrome P450 CYP4/CYP19/CYP26 subfamily n=1 Tax=Handroanthus impetiginosus TaxID=429701 RepID=A0A2G9GQL0_9LAMI|nr:Cytochrome P450 CYP4/CYP19/CYP26 subfamily [Handroanthus impetiginosus]
MDISLASLFAVIATALYLSLLILYLKTKLHKTINLPPGKIGWPLIGEMKDFALSCARGELEKFFSDRMGRYNSPDVFKTSLLGKKIVVFCSPAGNKFVFSNENKLVKSWVPDSASKIVLADHADVEKTAKLQIRTFAYEFLKPDVIQKYIKTMDSIISQHLDQEWAQKQTLTVYPIVQKLLFSLSCSIFMGIEDKNLTRKLEDQFEIVTSGLFSMPFDLPGTKVRRGMRAGYEMRSELRKIVRQKRSSENKDGNSGSVNLLSYLLSATDSEGKLFSEEEIACIVLAVLIGSQHTTSSLITNLVYFLADNPAVYDRVLKEQLEIRKLKVDDKQLLNWEDTKRMKYSRIVLNETLRIAPTAIGFFRDVIHDFNFAGYTVPKGWKIFLSPNTIHKNPKYYPNPDKFDPSRFEGKGPSPFTFTAFGGGPRMCPGNEFAPHLVLVFMHNLLIRFTWEKLIPKEKIIYDGAVNGPEHGLPIKLQRRCHEPEIDAS